MAGMSTCSMFMTRKLSKAIAAVSLCSGEETANCILHKYKVKGSVFTQARTISFFFKAVCSSSQLQEHLPTQLNISSQV